MAFIKDSVGTQAKNNQSDVVVICELIIMAHQNNSFLLPLTISRLRDEITFFLFANDAVREFFAFAAKFNSFFNQMPAFKPQNATIHPDDLYYRLLLALVVCGRRRPSLADYENNPLLNQAMTGRISYETFKSIVGQAKCATLTAAGLKAREQLKDARVKAFLDTIAWAEGFKANRVLDYDDASNFVQMDDLSKHPNKTLPGGYSSAAGRYQFMTKTWNEVQPKLGLFDFTPESQDIAAVFRLQTRPTSKQNILDAFLSDDFNEAVQRASNEWASFPDKNKGDAETNPTSHFKGQPAAKSSELWREYQDALVKHRR